MKTRMKNELQTPKNASLFYANNSLIRLSIWRASRKVLPCPSPLAAELLHLPLMYFGYVVRYYRSGILLSALTFSRLPRLLGHLVKQS